MKTHIMLHDAETNYPFLILITNIGAVEKINDSKEPGKSYIYFITPLSGGSNNDYCRIAVNETVEKIYTLLPQ